MFLTFEEWAPDRAAINTGMVRAMNLLPTTEGYETAPSLIPASYPPIPGGALPKVIKAFRSSDGSVFTLAFCLNKIYLLQTLYTWTDVTRTTPYTMGAEATWSVVPWGDMIYCGNG